MPSLQLGIEFTDYYNDDYFEERLKELESDGMSREDAVDSIEHEMYDDILVDANSKLGGMHYLRGENFFMAEWPEKYESK